MIVRITDSGVSVQDADDLTRLHVTSPLDQDRIADVLRESGLGRPAEAGHVWLDTSGLHELARAGEIGDDWEARWRKMIDYAASKGWTSADGTSLQAHVED